MGKKNASINNDEVDQEENAPIHEEQQWFITTRGVAACAHTNEWRGEGVSEGAWRGASDYQLSELGDSCYPSFA